MRYLYVMEGTRFIDLSVLMSVYCKEDARFLRASLESVFSQTWRAREVLLLKDGPLTAALDAVVDEFASRYSELRVVGFAENRGLGHCLNDGLQLCSYDIIARMDSDDVCMAQRFEKEYQYLLDHADCDLVGSWVDEFSVSTDVVDSVRRVPEDADAILRYARSRCPVNHPTVMYRKQAVVAAGGYLTEYFPEDYFLWIRMLMRGSRFYNFQESLVWFRYSLDTVVRRGGWRYAVDELKVQRNIYRLGFISFPRFVLNVLIRFTTRILPARLRRLVYKRMRKTKS